MKKKLSAVIAALAALLTSLFMTASTVSANDIRIILDGYDVYFDVAPQIISDRTMVPMRAIFEALSYNVEWNQVTEEIMAYGSQGTIGMKIGNYAINKNGEYIIIDTAPLIVNGRTLIPVRAISEVLGYTVTWDGSNGIIYIDSQNGLLSVDAAKEKVLSAYGGTWMGSTIGVAYSSTFEYNGKTYYSFSVKGYVDNHATTLTDVIIAADNSEMFEGRYNLQTGKLDRY